MSGWIEWKGGDCPVSGECVEVWMRGDAPGNHETTRAPELLRWSHLMTDTFLGSGDIIAYRLKDPHHAK